MVGTYANIVINGSARYLQTNDLHAEADSPTHVLCESSSSVWSANDKFFIWAFVETVWRRVAYETILDITLQMKQECYGKKMCIWDIE